MAQVIIKKLSEAQNSFTRMFHDEDMNCVSNVERFIVGFAGLVEERTGPDSRLREFVHVERCLAWSTLLSSGKSRIEFFDKHRERVRTFSVKDRVSLQKEFVAVKDRINEDYNQVITTFLISYINFVRNEADGKGNE